MTFTNLRAWPRRRRALAARPSRVLLHVGHGKTGSSFLQSALANSVQTLADNGLAYPIKPEAAAAARAGGISSGNMAPSARALTATLTRGWKGPQETLLISSETFFYKMRLKGFAEALRSLLPEADLQVLLYVRDPLDHAVSKYQQSVKRGGFTGDFDTFLQSYNTPGNVAQFLKWLQGELPSATVTLRNYSRHKDDLMTTFETWMGLTPGTLRVPARTQVNRSMTNAELMLQRAFNAHLDARTAAIVSNALCEDLPDIRSERPPASPEALDAFLTSMARMIERHGMNEMLPEGEAYRLETLDEAVARFDATAPDSYALTPAQMAVVAKALAAHIRPVGA